MHCHVTGATEAVMIWPSCA